MKKTILRFLILVCTIFTVGISVAEVIPLSYTPVEPCRIADTRKAGGAISPGGIRCYNVWGAVVSQGGNSAGCPSPNGEPRAVHINVTAVPTSGQGWLIAYPFNSTAPLASLANFRAGGHPNSNAGPVKTCYNCDKDISVKVGNASAHVVIDVFGYYE